MSRSGVPIFTLETKNGRRKKRRKKLKVKKIRDVV